VYVSDGINKTPGRPLLEYFLLDRTLIPNRETVYEIRFDERDLADGPLLGKFLQFVKIVFIAKVEDPGLAEIEVDVLGENIAFGTLERGGWVQAGTGIRPAASLFDGKMWTYWVVRLLGDDWAENGGWLRWDLGSQFWVDTIRILSVDTRARNLDDSAADVNGFKLYVSDGTEAVRPRPKVWLFDGKNFVWEKVGDVQNDASPPVLQFDLTFEPRRVRYIFFHHFYGSGSLYSRAVTGAKISEMQLFGEGYVAGVTMESELVDMGIRKNLTSVSYQAETPPGSRIEIRTRTGDEVVEERHYYSKQGSEIPKVQYDRLPPPIRGPVVIKQVPDEKYWSPWSSVYPYSGAPFLSPSPRRFLLVEAKLVSDDPQSAPVLDSITLSYTQPAAKSLYGSIEPRVAFPGRPQRFRFSIQPSSSAESAGFDQVALTMPNRADSVAVQIGGRAVVPSSIAISEDSLLIRLPRMVRNEEIQIEFRCTLFVNSTLFEAMVGNSRREGLWQRVDPQPAEKGATTVLLSSLADRETLIRDLAVDPPVLTPNGDGMNDHVSVQFNIFKLSAPKRVCVSVYNRAGEEIKPLYDALGLGGFYEGISWDGTDTSEHPVPPGVYILRVCVGSDAGEGDVSRVLTVVY
jgi:hypothetical protein